MIGDVRRETARVFAVHSAPAGDELAADTLAGATTLTVLDASDFSETGGTLVINDEVLPYASADDETGVITLAVYDDDGTPTQAVLGSNASEGDRVDVFDPASGSVAQEVVAYLTVEGADFNDDAVEAIVPHNLIPFLPEGIREPDEGETVSLQWVNGDPVIVDVEDQSATLSNTDAGWELSPDGVSFSDVDVAGILGAQEVIADVVTIGGEDLLARLDQMPKGLVSATTVNTGITTGHLPATSQTIIGYFNGGVLEANRRYLVLCQFFFASQTGGLFQWRIFYDTAGAIPTNADPGNNILDGAEARKGTSGTPNGDETVQMMGYFETTSSWPAVQNGDPVYFALTVQLVNGSATVQLPLDDWNRSLQFLLFDMGSTDVPRSSGFTQLAGTTGSTPPTTYTKNWYANSSQAYDGDGSKRLGDENTPDLYQGYYSSTHGNTKSAFGFDDADIRSKLSGATIKKVQLTFRVKHAYYGAGMDVRFRTHGNSSMPSTWSGISGLANEQYKNNAVAGATYTITLPNSVGDAFKSGSARGFAVGNGPTTSKDYYGYLYGPSSGSAPKLTITYEK